MKDDREGYNIFNPHYYKRLKSTHPESSSQETSIVPSEPFTEVDQLAMQDSSGSSDLAGKGNKDLESIQDVMRKDTTYMTHNIMHGCITLPIVRPGIKQLSR